MRRVYANGQAHAASMRACASCAAHLTRHKGFAPTHTKQVADIRTIKDAMREASQLYTELVRVGAAMGMLDVGGGLGVEVGGVDIILHRF